MGLSRATLGGGCFWCLDAAFKTIDGVVNVRSGYAGGQDPEPHYEKVITGTTGHAEVVDITFDDSIITYKDILKVFFSIHDPTTKDRQGNDVGTQYRSLILYHDEKQRVDASDCIKAFDLSGKYDSSAVTEVKEFDVFHPAEEYHQDYFRRNPMSMYCRLVVDPKVRKAKEVNRTLRG